MSEELKPEEIFAEGGAAKVIAIAEKEAAEFVPDVTTIKGREAIKSKAYAIGSTMKAKFDKLGKEYGEDLKKKAKVIDGERAKIRKRLEELGEQIRRPVNEFEAREEARINLIKEQIAALEVYGVIVDEETADSIQGRINAINGFNFTDWQEFETQADDTKFNILALLGKRLIAVAKAEEERKELDRLRAEEQKRKDKEVADEAERLRVANEEKLKKDAADKAIADEQARQAEAKRIADEEAKRLADDAAKAIKDTEEADARALKAEQDKKEAAEQAERDRLAAAQKAEADRIAALKKAEEEKTAAVEAERQRIAKAKADEEEAAKKREADIEHKKAVNNDALKAIAEHAKISEDDAKNVVIAIAMGMVPSVKIFY